jgi:hypothetical protein
MSSSLKEVQTEAQNRFGFKQYNILDDPFCCTSYLVARKFMDSFRVL